MPRPAASGLTSLSLRAGLAWGLAGYALGARAFGPALWAGTLAGPLIGLMVGRLVQHRFQTTTGWRRWAWALASLYLGVVCFGAAIAVGGVVLGEPGTGAVSVERLLEPVVTALWGVTIGSFWLFLWPLAYGTHWLIEWRLDAPPPS